MMIPPHTLDSEPREGIAEFMYRVVRFNRRYACQTIRTDFFCVVRSAAGDRDVMFRPALETACLGR